jgi:hypothetical protein
MKKLVLLALLLGALPLVPGEAAAQCNSECLPLIKNGQIQGYGCVNQPGSQVACLASSRGCQLDPCFTSIVRDSDGSALALGRECDGAKPSLTAGAERQWKKRWRGNGASIPAAAGLAAAERKKGRAGHA